MMLQNVWGADSREIKIARFHAFAHPNLDVPMLVS